MGASTRTPAQLEDAVLTAFGAHWTAAGQSLSIVAWDNIKPPTQAGGAEFPANLDAYVQLGLAHSSGDLASLGGGNAIKVRRQVIFAGQIFVRHNTGKALANQLGEILLDFLESTQLTGIRIRNPSLIEAGRALQWFQLNVNAQIEYDSIRTV